MEFVNIHGQPITPGDGQVKKKSSRPQQGAYHKGWRAVGFPPDVVAAAKQRHLAAIEAARAQGRNLLPWDQEMFMRNTRPIPVRSKPYETPGAADSAAELAGRMGWLGVTVIEVAKGK